MSRLIIDVRDGISDEDAITAVKQVVAEGRVSQAAGIPHYCWATVFTARNLVVAVRRKKTNASADSFIVAAK